MSIISIACTCGNYETQDPNDAHFDVPGHDPADVETSGSWNAFDQAKPEDVERQDGDALDRIQAVMSGSEWSADTLDEIASAVRASGREIKDVHDD